MLAIRRVEQNAHGLLCLGAQDHDPRINLSRFSRVAIDIQDSTCTVGIGVHENLVHHSVRNQGAIARLPRVGHRGERSVEIRAGLTSSLARPAVVAGRASFQRAGKIGGAGRGHGPAELFLGPIAKKRFLASERHGRLKFAVRQFAQTFGLPADTYVLFHQVVVRLEILVTQRPIFAVAIVAGGFEIVIAKAQADASPNIRATARHPQTAEPMKRFVAWGRVGFLQIVAKPFVVVLGADFKFRLDRARLANDLWREIAILQIEYRLVLRKVFERLRAPGLQQSYLQAGFRQSFASPATGRSGTHHHYIERLLARIDHSALKVSFSPVCTRLLVVSFRV